MVLHTCEKCNKEFDKKSNYNVHINKKKSCLKNVLNKDNTIKIFQNIPNNSKIFHKAENNINIDNECKFCHKIYSQVYNLNKHLKTCKTKKQKECDKEEIFKQLIEKQDELTKQNNQQKEMIQTLITQVAKLTNSKLNNKNIVKNSNNKTTNSNNTTNIIMMDFGKEDLQIIDKSEFMRGLITFYKIKSN